MERIVGPIGSIMRGCTDEISSLVVEIEVRNDL